MHRVRSNGLVSIVAVAVFAVLSQIPISGAAAPTSPSDDSTHPVVMQQAAQQMAKAKPGLKRPFISAAPLAPATGSTGLQRETFGFALASSLNDPTVGDPTWNFSLLSTVAFFGLHVQNDGHFASDSGSAVWNSSELTDLINLAHPHGTKVVVTIIEQDFSAGTPNMCAALKNASTTVADTVAQVTAKGVDGVNVDYEGLNGSCGTSDPSWARHALTAFAASLRSALPAGSYLSIDTYASSASDSLGFFDIPNLAPSVDSFFVMAYDLEYSNWSRAPVSCASFCLGPTAPLKGYYYNDTSTAAQYTSAVAASKVILGVPYYGRKSCVAGFSPNAYPTGTVTADTYLDAVGESSSTLVQPGTYATHRDANDPSGQERWDTWFNPSLGCDRELYWDDTVSLAHKYALVNTDGLRGVGFWNLNYGGPAPELWCLLAGYFTSTGYTGAPVVSGVAPLSGPPSGGTAVAVTGCGLTGATAVKFGVAAASGVTAVSDTLVDAISPAGAPGAVDVTVTNPAGTSQMSSEDRFTYLAGAVYTAQAPLRILDTRSAGGRIGPGQDRVLAVGGVDTPGSASAVVINVTVTDVSSAGALTVYPAGGSRPTASNLNWASGQTVANLVSVGLGAGGEITIHNYAGYADVVVDLEGYFAPPASGSAGEFASLPAVRIADTRPGSGQPDAGSTLSAGSTLNVQVTGAGGVPATGAAAAVLNVTVTDTSASSALIVFPAGTARPLASNLNWTAGRTVPNRVVVPIGTGGQVSIYNYAGSADVVVDVNGYFTDSSVSGAAFFSLSPARILDTRSGTGGIHSPLGPNSSVAVTVAGLGGVPPMGAPAPPKAVVVNVTVTDTTAPSALIVWPDGAPRPLASDLNWTAGSTVPNLVVVQVGGDGKIDLYNYAGSTDVVIDVVGWFG